jgi:GTPase SAR1 family protein
MPIVSYEDMKQKKGEVSHCLIDLAGIVDELHSLGVEFSSEALLDLKNKVDNDNFKVLVIGEFKNGKSTFINALMGDKVLPAYSTPCTAVINEVVYGKEKKAMLYFKNPLPEEMPEAIQPKAMQHIEKYKGGEIPPIEVDVADLVDYVAIPDPSKDQADSIKELPYSKVILEYPIELCHDGIEIIDSPGLNENGVRTKVTEEYLNRADAILFVFRCPKIAGASEIDYITNQIHARGYNDIFFICNAINQIPEDEQDRLIKFGNKKLSPLTKLGEDGIFYVDALGALNAKRAKDNSALSITGMPEFESALSEYLRNNRGKAKLMQVVVPCKSFISDLQTQRIKAYIANLNQDVTKVEKKIKDAMPQLDLAEAQKDLAEKKIAEAMQNLQKKVFELMDAQYGQIINQIPEAVENMDLENHMTVNPFNQKSKKEALEKEVIDKLQQFVEKEMGKWIKTDLKTSIDEFVDQLERDLGKNIDVFYENLDGFRYEVSGVEKPKDISGFERVSATILGTLAGGPTYGMLGASLGFGEIAKRSAITVGATTIGGAILAFTPVGIAAITTVATVAVVGAGIAQFVTGGTALTEKYKKLLKGSFVESLKKSRENDCKQYSISVSNDVKEKFALVIQALNEEIKVERAQIKSLEKDKQKSEADREQKRAKLKQLEEGLTGISDRLAELEAAIG